MGFRRRGPATEVAEPTVAPTKTATKAVPAKSSGGGKTYHNDALTILEGKDGSFYVQVSKKFEGEITVNGKKVTGMISKDPMVQLQESVEAGRLSEEKAQAIADKIPEFIKANVTLVTE